MIVIVRAPGLRESRLRRGLTVARLADLTDVAPRVLAAVESGTRQPGSPLRQRLMHALDAGFDDLFTTHVVGGAVGPR